MKDLLAIFWKILRERKLDAVVLSNSRCIKPINDFNNIDEIIEYINSTYCDSILIKKIGRKSFTEQIYFHQVKGFKLNEKSITLSLNNGGKIYRKNIRF